MTITTLFSCARRDPRDRCAEEGEDMSDEAANNGDLVDLTMQKAQQLNAHLGLNPFRDEPVVETLREVLDPRQKPAATLAQPTLQLTDLDLDRAIRLRWTLRDIRAKRTILSPVSSHDLTILLEMGLIEIRGDDHVLTNKGDRALA
jgi:hypothetical protein